MGKEARKARQKLSPQLALDHPRVPWQLRTPFRACSAPQTTAWVQLEAVVSSLRVVRLPHRSSAAVLSIRSLCAVHLLRVDRHSSVGLSDTAASTQVV